MRALDSLRHVCLLQVVECAVVRGRFLCACPPRMSFDQFLSAMSEVAVRRYGLDVPRGESFKRLIKEVSFCSPVTNSRATPSPMCECVYLCVRPLQHVLPLKKLLKRVPDDLSQELGIADRLATPEVVRPEPLSSRRRCACCFSCSRVGHFVLSVGVYSD